MSNELATNEPDIIYGGVVETAPTPLDAHGQVIASDEPQESPPGNQGTGYYRLLNDHEEEYYREKGYLAGNLVYVYAGLEGLHSFVGDSEFTYQYDHEERMATFAENYRFVPNGAEERQKQIAALMDEINKTDISLNNSKTALGSFNPHVGVSGGVEGSTSLVASTAGMSQMKLAVATTRNSVLKAQKNLAAKTKQLKELASEQSRALAIKVREIQELAKKAEEAIWTINLYLGREEEIVHLVRGEPAPSGQKIVIRQCVLNMDEECGIDAKDDGIDVRSIDKFDNWLTADIKHLTQIVPETKGIVALHIRRRGKKYEDPWVQKELNDANLSWTYFVIRNGDNVYRVHIDMDVGSHLFPSISEFEDYFWTRNGDDERVPLKPGSKEWNKAMDSAEARQKHHMRVLLVLQGLMDRTPIFKPMPIDRINLCDPRHCEEWLQLIYESEKVLTDGVPDFRKWQKEINDQLEVGCRIIGVFDYRSGVKGHTERGGRTYGCRIYPENASFPPSSVLHTIDERENANYIFRYARTDSIYKRYEGYSEPKVRARCWVEKNDDFFLNFDAITLDRLEYYKGHKLSRQYYETMLPVLEAAIALKHEEMVQEAPFRQLLIGQIMAQHEAEYDETVAIVDDLMKWWKYKNRTHRALVSDDTKALTMIVDEFEHRRKQTRIRLAMEQAKDVLLKVIGSQTPAPVLIAHKKDNQYVAYVPHNDQNIWVTEQLWTLNRQTGHVALKEVKQWKTVDKRHERWETIYKSDRWDNWQILPVMSSIITDPEIDKLVEAGMAMWVKPESDSEPDDDNDNRTREAVLPLAAIISDDFKISFWYSSCGATLPQQNIINSRIDGPIVNRAPIKWKRGVNGVEVTGYRWESNRYCTNLEKGNRPWERDHFGDQVRGRVIKIWEDNVELVYQEQVATRALEKKVRRLESSFDHIDDLVAKLLYDQKVREERLKFDADYGDPELWEDHLSSLKIAPQHMPLINSALHLLLERDIDPTGMTLVQLYDEAAKHGLIKGDGDDSHSYGRRKKLPKIPDNIPHFVITAKPDQEEEDDDD